MARGTGTIAAPTAGRSTADESSPPPADVLVVFGITGDLAKVMTFHSLYRLEARGLLDCPIVGVAVDDWTDDQLRERARTSIEGTGEKLDEKIFDRLGLAPLVRERRLLGGRDVRASRRSDRRGDDARLLSGDPALPVRPRGQGPGRGRPDGYGAHRGREALRTRRGIRYRAGRRAAPVHRRVAALPHRSLPGEDGPRGDPASPLRELDARADLEPRPHRVGRDHHGRELRRRGPRPFLRPCGRSPRRRRQPSDAGRGGIGDGDSIPERARR